MRIYSTTKIIAQPNLWHGLLAFPHVPTRISAMLKKRGPYLRPPKPKVFLRPRKQHFLKEYRLLVGMTQDELAEEAGLSTGSISAMERGDQEPSMQTLQALADALKISRGELLDINPAQASESRKR